MSVVKNLWKTTRRLLEKNEGCLLIDKKLSSGFVPINGTKLYYEKNGNAKDTILCIPGALGSTRNDFSYQLNHLSSNFTVIAFDPRGYGQSRADAKRDFPQNFYHRDANDGAKLMKELGYEKYSVLGWSDGGVSGIILAAREKKYIEKLVVWGSNSFVSEEDKVIVEKTRDLNNWSEGMRKPLEDLYGRKGLEELWNNWMNAYLKFMENANGDICISELKQIECPTLIIHGAKDAMLASFHPEFILKNIKSSKLVVWPEGKHNLHMRFYKEFNELVTSFLRQ